MVGGHHFDSPSDLARETAFKIYYTGDRQQEMILSSLVETRHQLATLCGYETFGHRAVSSSLAQTPENINMFLTSLAEQMEPRLRGEYSTMSKMKERSCSSGRQAPGGWSGGGPAGSLGGELRIHWLLICTPVFLGPLFGGTDQEN